MSKEIIKPYGDRLNDGIVQLSFTLPVEKGARAQKAAELYVSGLNFENVIVAHSKKIADNFTFFVVYANAIPSLDYTTVKATEVETGKMSFNEINEFIRKEDPLSLTFVKMLMFLITFLKSSLYKRLNGGFSCRAWSPVLSEETKNRKELTVYLRDLTTEGARGFNPLLVQGD